MTWQLNCHEKRGAGGSLNSQLPLCKTPEPAPWRSQLSTAGQWQGMTEHAPDPSDALLRPYIVPGALKAICNTREVTASNLDYTRYIWHSSEESPMHISVGRGSVSYSLADISVFPSIRLVKHLPAMQETWVYSLGREDPLEKEMATHSCTLAWKIPWTEEPGRFLGEPWGLKELDTIERLHFLSFFHLSVCFIYLWFCWFLWWWLLAWFGNSFFLRRMLAFCIWGVLG